MFHVCFGADRRWSYIRPHSLVTSCQIRIRYWGRKIIVLGGDAGVVRYKRTALRSMTSQVRPQTQFTLVSYTHGEISICQQFGCPTRFSTCRLHVELH